MTAGVVNNRLTPSPLLSADREHHLLGLRSIEDRCGAELWQSVRGAALNLRLDDGLAVRVHDGQRPLGKLGGAFV
jgi:hypothetical protein